MDLNSLLRPGARFTPRQIRVSSFQEKERKDTGQATQGIRQSRSSAAYAASPWFAAS